MPSEIQRILARIHRAKSIDEGDEYSDELSRAARRNIDEVIRLFHTKRDDTFMLVWCLQGLTNPRVVEIFKQAIKHKDQYVRWAAVEGLKHSTKSELIPTFIAALNDRAHIVKLVAVEWLKVNGDASAIGPLERIIKLPGVGKDSPGIVKEAKEAVKYLRNKAR